MSCSKTFLGERLGETGLNQNERLNEVFSFWHILSSCLLPAGPVRTLWMENVSLNETKLKKIPKRALLSGYTKTLNIYFGILYSVDCAS
jgi:hypothetical protein